MSRTFNDVLRVFVSTSCEHCLSVEQSWQFYHCSDFPLSGVRVTCLPQLGCPLVDLCYLHGNQDNLVISTHGSEGEYQEGCWGSCSGDSSSISEQTNGLCGLINFERFFFLQNLC